MREFTSDEKKQWLANQPKKPSSSKVAILNKKNEVLVLALSYKPGWHFPGGMLNDGESPMQAAVREVKEETGIETAAESLRFLGVRYGVSRQSGGDYYHFLFTARISEATATIIRLDRSEATDYKWLSVERIDDSVSEPYGKFAHGLLNGKSTHLYSDNDIAQC